MASRENQGLNIAVIVLSMMTIGLAVTTYIAYASASSSATQAEADKKARQDAEATLSRATYRLSALQMMMGLNNIDAAQVDAAKARVTDPTTLADVDKWRADFAADMSLVGESVGAEGARNYRTLPMYLLGEIAKKNSSVVAANTLADDYKKQKDTEVASEKERVKQAEAARDTASSDLGKERDTFNNDRTKITQEKEKLASELEKKDKVAKKALEDAGAKFTDVSSKVNNLIGLVQSQTERIKELTKETGVTLENPDGKVVWVDQKQQLVWINLGSADGLGRQTTFSVFDQEQTSIFDKSKLALAQNAAATSSDRKNKSASKGRIEVVRIVDDHQAECRILEDTAAKPILPGDWIQTPVWSPGQKTHFALVGFMDIDGDGRSDRELVRNIIKLNGGIIDAELLDDGTRLPGKMSVNTRYLVSGLKPTDRKAPVDAERSGNYQKEYNRLMEEKTQYGVDEISIREMLDQMGWRAEERKVEIGSRGDGSSFRKRSPGARERPAAAAPAAEGTPATEGDAEAPAMEAETAPAAEGAEPAASGADPFGD